MADLRSELVHGLDLLGLGLEAGQIDQLLAYQGLLQKWNGVYNLTAVREPRDMLYQHLLDSLAVVAPLQRALAGCTDAAPRLLDVGSGGGLPGVVLAICIPELAVTCVDTVAKKAAFLQQVAVSLGLSNLRGVHARVEALQGSFHVITSRAFASLADFTRLSSEQLAPQGVWMAMKAKRPEAEMADLDAAKVEVFHVEPLHVPGLEAERCLVWMRPRTDGSQGVAPA